MGLLKRLRLALRSKQPPPEDAFLDGCDLDFTEDPTPDEESDLFVLFAEALDPNNPKSVKKAKREWEKLFNASK